MMKVTSERFQRMKEASPDYYEFSQVHDAIVSAWDTELGTVDANNEDLALQLRIVTATWGLRYWEKQMGIPTVSTDSYAIRRSRVLSKRRGYGQFSAAMIESMAEAYSGGEVAVTFDRDTGTVTIKFIGTRGIPSNLDDLKAAIDNVIHAHLGTAYSFTYLTFGGLAASGKTFGGIEAAGLTFKELESWGV